MEASEYRRCNRCVAHEGRFEGTRGVGSSGAIQFADSLVEEIVGHAGIQADVPRSEVGHRNVSEYLTEGSFSECIGKIYHQGRTL